jgi:hypothetical protein
MSNILYQLKLTPASCFDGLVQVSENLPRDISLSEKRIIQDTLKISKKDIDFVFFRRFTKDDIRTSQAVAYIIDNTSGKLSKESLARLHHTLWLSGIVPLLYIDNEDSVDILSCAAKPAAEKAKDWTYNPLDEILANAENINEQIKRFSAFRLANGTFWEDRRNKDYINTNKSAHNVLLEKIKQADKEINGESNPVARRLLLITLLVKYLEDRGVFNSDHKFFSRFTEGAKSFYDVLKKGTLENLENLLKCLENKFNGDIFVIKNNKINQNMIKKITSIVSADIDANGQLYFWDIYNFEHIPVEVISHIYQYFTEKGQGAVFTPILLVNLMLDQVMPLERIKGDEKIFDPTCGSGIFLVSAFRRLIYVNQQKNNKWLNPQALVGLLKNSIFGVELHEEAAYITSFSLALAVCDALQPDIIWHELQFEKTVEHNIFIGDFGKRGKDALMASESDIGFDIILGNAPFIKELTPAIIEDLNKNNKTIPDKQLAYYVLIASIEKYLSEYGKICMIQPYGFLYNAQTMTMRCNLFSNFTIDKILDFVSINGLFHDANTKAIAILAKKEKPSFENKIVHLTFRRTVAIKEKICFELDYYDYHSVLQREVINEEYKWKANLLGGGRLVQLAQRLGEIPTIQEYIDSKKWYAQVGLKFGRTSKKAKQADWLYNKPLLTSNALHNHVIEKKLLIKVDTKRIREPKSENAFLPPLMIISQMDTLDSAFWNNSFLAYTHEFIGIKAPKENENELASFFKIFKENIMILQSCVLLLGFRTLAGRSTATYKTDIMDLPYPSNGDFNLVPWEKELLDDIRNYMAEYVRIGQNSELLKTEASEEDLLHYSQTFLRLMNKAYPNLKKCKEQKNNDFRLIAFSFTGDDNSLPELNDSNWLETLSSLIEKEKNDILRTQRVIRIHTGDILIIVKPNKLRYWIRSTAIRDVDDVIVEIIKGGE